MFMEKNGRETYNKALLRTVLQNRIEFHVKTLYAPLNFILKLSEN